MVPCLAGALHSYCINLEESERAWHIISLLVCFGRPASPHELASSCRLFAASPDSLRHLCSIPNSPLHLAANGTVTASKFAIRAFREFAEKAVSECVPRSGIRSSGLAKVWDDDIKAYSRKRKADGSVTALAAFRPTKRQLRQLLDDGSEENHSMSSYTCRIRYIMAEETDSKDAQDFPSVRLPVTEEHLGVSNYKTAIAPLHFDSAAEYPGRAVTENGCETMAEMKISRFVPASRYWDSMFNYKTDLTMLGLKVRGVAVTKQTLLSSLSSSYGTPILFEEAGTGRLRSSGTYHAKIDEQQHASSMEAVAYDCHVLELPVIQVVEDINSNMGSTVNKGGLLDVCSSEDQKNCAPLDKPSEHEGALRIASIPAKSVNATYLVKEQIVRKSDYAECSSTQIPTVESFGSWKFFLQKDLPSKLQDSLDSLKCNKIINSSKQQDRCREDRKFINMKKKLKQSHNSPMRAKEHSVDPHFTKSQVAHQDLPHFESFLVEQKEGSGGYGTVYRARRKRDGKLVAIKCPHENAHKHHVKNEQKMLERFGGRNFIINYRGTIKSGNADYFILDHVEHDRPEILKREIDIFDLQWYGYCMFKALAYLHKQGVAHRDVKPGNFLFSRMIKKGYLIDFNLAMDLQQKYAPGMSKEKNLENGESSAVSGGPKIGARTSFGPKNPRKKVIAGSLKAFAASSGRKLFGSQGGEVSGITSTKDATSIRTPTDRPREPIPSQGRKELINLVQGAMKSPSHISVNIHASQRKRVSAPPSKADSKIYYLSPMPVHCNGVAVAGAGLQKGKGDGKLKKEGPCVGTKGFRAPEVLFRSSHQGLKVDVWSAGVSLLYLMVGRTPFVGDPEQNIKDIVKLRGSEDLWELAKLHNCESSFPTELFDMQLLPSVKLQEWCRSNTKRSELLNCIPASLFDLVDKCLTVNPRLRIGAEEALEHEFFAPCRDIMKKQRMLRQQLNLDQSDSRDGFLRGLDPVLKVLS